MKNLRERTDDLIREINKIKKPDRVCRLKCLFLVIDSINSLKAHCEVLGIDKEFREYNQYIYTMLSDLETECNKIGDNDTVQFIDEMIFYFNEYLRLERNGLSKDRVGCVTQPGK